MTAAISDSFQIRQGYNLLVRCEFLKLHMTMHNNVNLA